jgi:hypothetical protein
MVANFFTKNELKCLFVFVQEDKCRQMPLQNAIPRVPFDIRLGRLAR